MTQNDSGASRTTAQDGHTGQIAPLTNVALALAAVNQVCDQAATGAPHMAVLYGAPGMGKTQAAMFLAHPQGKDGIFVSLRSFETTKSLAQLLLRELGVNFKGYWSVADMYEAIIDRLGQMPQRPVIFDELDYIAEKSAIDLIRTVHDNSLNPIFMIGEERLKGKLQRHHERFHDRVLVWQKTLPCDEADVFKLAAQHAADMRLDPAARRALISATGGVARRIYTELRALRQEALKSGVSVISADMVAARAGVRR